MRIKKLYIANYQVIREATLDELPDTVVIAGPNGVGKTTVKEAICETFRNNRPPNGCSVVLEATNKDEVDGFGGKEEITLPDKLFWNFFGRQRKKLAAVTRVIHINSDRQISEISLHAYTLDQIGKPDEESADHSWGINKASDRFKDVCNTIYRLKSQVVTKIGNETLAKIKASKGTPVNVDPVDDPTQPFLDLFGKLLHPKKMDEVRQESRTFTYTDETGTSRKFASLSSGEKEVVAVAFDIQLQKPNDSIILIDEPELHLHPELSFRLLKTLNSIGERNQFFLFTHSADIIGASFDKGVHFLRPKSVIQSGDQVQRIDENTLSSMSLVPNLRESVGMISLGKKLLFVEGESNSIDRSVFSARAQTSKPHIAIIPSSGCRNITHLANTAEMLAKGIFGIEIAMVRDRDGLTESEITSCTTKSNGRLHVLPFCHIENVFLVPDAIHDVSKDILLSNAPTRSEIENKMVELANRQVQFCVALYLKSEAYFQAADFDISPKGDVNKMDLQTLLSEVKKQRDLLLSAYNSKFSDDQLRTRAEFWENCLRAAIKNGWSEDARKFFYGKRLLNELQAWLFQGKQIRLWEHMINSKHQSAIAALKPIDDILNAL